MAGFSRSSTSQPRHVRPLCRGLCLPTQCPAIPLPHAVPITLSVVAVLLLCCWNKFLGIRVENKNHLHDLAPSVKQHYIRGKGQTPTTLLLLGFERYPTLLHEYTALHNSRLASAVLAL